MHWKIYYSKVHLTENVYPLVILKIQKFGRLKGNFILFMLKFYWKYLFLFWVISAYTLHKKWSFPLRISSVNVTKSEGNCGFGHIY